MLKREVSENKNRSNLNQVLKNRKKFFFKDKRSCLPFLFTFFKQFNKKSRNNRVSINKLTIKVYEFQKYLQLL